MKPYYIYGIFHGAVCFYVGRTKNLKQRKRAHIKSGRFPDGVWFRLLETVIRGNASRIEGKWILRFKKRGEAKFNKIVTLNGMTAEMWAAFRNEVSTKIFALSRDPSKHFHVSKVGLRNEAWRIGKELRDAGKIDVRISTHTSRKDRYVIFSI